MLCHLSGFALNSPMRFCPSGRAAGGCAEGVGRVRVPCATRAGLSYRHRLSLLERVSAEAVTSTLHQVTRERMEDRCRGEYERSFLREFHKVRRPCPPPTDEKRLLAKLTRCLGFRSGQSVVTWVNQGAAGD